LFIEGTKKMQKSAELHPAGSNTPTVGPVFVTGATGYIGGRLVPRLLEAGYRVRCFVRSPRKLSGRSWSTDPRVEILAGDLSTAGSSGLADAMAGCSAAYYLVHSMVSAGQD
jgi:uncharacterized protein YbjT (DUF2867 family)